MNTTLTQRFTSLAIAAVLTLGMLFSVNGLATSDVNPAQMARVMAQQQA